MIGQTILKFSDSNGGVSDVSYTLDSIPANGTLYLDTDGNGQPDGAAEILSAGESFAQADINAGRLTYDHDGSDTTTDSFQFDVTDEVGNATSDQTFSITVTQADTEVTLAGGTLTVTDVEGGDSADKLIISYSGGTYTITDTGGLIIDASSIADSGGNGTSTVTVPDSGVTAIDFDVLDGDDSVTASSFQSQLSGGLTVAGGVGTDAISIDAATSTGGGDVVLSAESVSTTQAISAGTGSITITADTVSLGDALSGSGTLTIAPQTPSRSIGVGGGTGDLNLDDIELAFLTDGFGAIVIGDASTGAGDIDVDSSTFTDDVTTVGGAVSVSGLDAGIDDFFSDALAAASVAD